MRRKEEEERKERELKFQREKKAKEEEELKLQEEKKKLAEEEKQRAVEKALRERMLKKRSEREAADSKSNTPQMKMSPAGKDITPVKLSPSLDRGTLNFVSKESKESVQHQDMTEEEPEENREEPMDIEVDTDERTVIINNKPNAPKLGEKGTKWKKQFIEGEEFQDRILQAYESL